MTENWSKSVPSQYSAITTCYYVEKQYNNIQGVDAVICTRTGQLAEFKNNHISRACEIKTDSAESITSFTKYGPYCKYYIVKSKNTLIIVANKEQLKVVHTLHNVKRFCVRDFWKAGFPQVGIWHVTECDTEVPDLITGFSEEVSTNDNTGGDTFAKFRNEKLQEIKFKISEAECKLKEKKKCKNRSAHSLLLKPFKIMPEIESQLILLTGPGRATHPSDIPQQLDSLKVTDVWQRVHHGHWIVGVSIHNPNERNITHLNLSLQCRGQNSVTYSMHLLACKVTFGDTAAQEWKHVDILQSEPAVVVGVFKQPTFMSSSVATISGVITYMVQGETDSESQFQVPCFQLNAEEFAMESLIPFTQKVITEADLLSVIVASYHVTVIVNSQQGLLRDVLVEQLGFEAVFGRAELVHKRRMKPGLAGVVLYLQKGRLHIYARDPPQVLLLVHCLYAALPVQANIVLPTLLPTPVDVDQSYESLHSELKLFIETLCEWMDKMKGTDNMDVENEPNIKVSRNIYSEFRKQLTALEMQTDMCTVDS